MEMIITLACLFAVMLIWGICVLRKKLSLSDKEVQLYFQEKMIKGDKK